MSPNSDRKGIGHGLDKKPILVLVLCYVAAIFALDLADEKEAEAILTYCEEYLDQE